MNHFDETWKDAIRLHRQDFLTFFFPDITAKVDWNIEPVMLDGVLVLPEPLIYDFLAQVRAIEEENHVVYLNSISTASSHCF